MKKVIVMSSSIVLLLFSCCFLMINDVRNKSKNNYNEVLKIVEKNMYLTENLASQVFDNKKQIIFLKESIDNGIINKEYNEKNESKIKEINSQIQKIESQSNNIKSSLSEVSKINLMNRNRIYEILIKDSVNIENMFSEENMSNEDILNFTNNIIEIKLKNKNSNSIQSSFSEDGNVAKDLNEKEKFIFIKPWKWFGN